MSLSKQLLILISGLFLIVFSVNFVLSVNNIRSYLEGESQIHAQDTATSLGLSLSPYMENDKDPVLETMMKAIFDRGYYKEIKLADVDGITLVTLTNEQIFEDVPEWFISAVPMQTASADSEISSGWNISGVISVAINPGYAYLKLYEQVKTSFYYSLIALVASIIVLLMVIRITLSSLKRIGEMAETISNGRFDIIEHLPWTLEVRNVAISMNSMSSKIEKVIQNLNRKLEKIGKKLHQDELTGLGKKSGFEADMKDVLSSHTEAYIFMIKIDVLSDLVKELSSEAIDLFIKEFSGILKRASENIQIGDVSAYRFFGSEFVLLTKDMPLEKVNSLANALSMSFAELGEKYQKKDIAHIGVAPFDPFSTAGSILLAANEAYEKAQLVGANGYYVRQSEDRAKDMAEWKALVFDIVDKEDYKISYISQVENFETDEVMMEEAFSKVLDKNGAALSIGTFVSIAEKFVKIVDLDKSVISRVMHHVKAEKIPYVVAINLSSRTIKNSNFREWLAPLLSSNEEVARHIAFSLPAYAVAKEMDVYQEFIDFAQHLNAKVIIKRFDTQSLSPEAITELKPDFIRLARDIGHGIEKDQAKQELTRTIVEICDLLDVVVLAENVKSELDFKCLKEIGVEGASR
ncbi:MAG: GGDEF domain-containing protein [Cycloclasticus sp.]|nr:MAG: GGDEF domain-containing protein [Cycloclasticus sp.]